LAFSRKVRKQILINANYKCESCGCDIKETLEAAHIVKHANNPEATKDWHGICLCANCHRIFDKTGKIKLNYKDEKEWPIWANKYDEK